MLFEVVLCSTLVQFGACILNGAKISDYPWFVSMQEGENHVCGGVLISDIWVLSDFFINKVTHIQYGVDDFRNKTVNRIKVVKIIQHENHSRDPFENFIALAKLNKSVVFGTRTFPAKLPESHFEVPENWETEVNMVGLGSEYYHGPYSTKLKAVKMILAPKGNCNESETFFCVGSKDGGKGACTGDYGGPLTLKSGLLVGMHSFFLDNCKSNFGKFSKIPMYIDWIKEKTKILP